MGTNKTQSFELGAFYLTCTIFGAFQLSTSGQSWSVEGNIIPTGTMKF